MAKFNIEFVGNLGQRPVPLSATSPVLDTGESIVIQVVQQGADAVYAAPAGSSSPFKAAYISRLAVSYLPAGAFPTAGGLAYHQDGIDCATGLPTGTILQAGTLPAPSVVATNYKNLKQTLYNVSPPSAPTGKDFTGAVYNDLFMFGGTIAQAKAAVISFLGGIDASWFGSPTVVGKINVCLVAQNTAGTTHTYPIYPNFPSATVTDMAGPLVIPDVSVVPGTTNCVTGTVTRFGTIDLTSGSGLTRNSGDTTPETNTVAVSFRIMWFPDAVAAQAGKIVQYILSSEIAPICTTQVSYATGTCAAPPAVFDAIVDASFGGGEGTGTPATYTNPQSLMDAWAATPNIVQASIQTISITGATSGQYELVYYAPNDTGDSANDVVSESTAAIQWNASATDVQNAIAALPSVGAGKVTVGLVGQVYTATFDISLGYVPTLSALRDTLSLTPDIAVTQTPLHGGNLNIEVKAGSYSAAFASYGSSTGRHPVVQRTGNLAIYIDPGVTFTGSPGLFYFEECPNIHVSVIGDVTTTSDYAGGGVFFYCDGASLTTCGTWSLLGGGDFVDFDGCLGASLTMNGNLRSAAGDGAFYFRGSDNLVVNINAMFYMYGNDCFLIESDGLHLTLNGVWYMSYGGIWIDLIGSNSVIVNHAVMDAYTGEGYSLSGTGNYLESTGAFKLQVGGYYVISRDASLTVNIRNMLPPASYCNGDSGFGGTPPHATYAPGCAFVTGNCIGTINGIAVNGVVHLRFNA